MGGINALTFFGYGGGTIWANIRSVCYPMVLLFGIIIAAILYTRYKKKQVIVFDSGRQKLKVQQIFIISYFLFIICLLGIFERYIYKEHNLMILFFIPASLIMSYVFMYLGKKYDKLALEDTISDQKLFDMKDYKEINVTSSKRQAWIIPKWIYDKIEHIGTLSPQFWDHEGLISCDYFDRKNLIMYHLESPGLMNFTFYEQKWLFFKLLNEMDAMVETKIKSSIMRKYEVMDKVEQMQKDIANNLFENDIYAPKEQKYIPDKDELIKKYRKETFKDVMTGETKEQPTEKEVNIKLMDKVRGLIGRER